MAKILVIRFSALGDVAMTVPVLCSFANSFPQHQVVVLSRPNMAALFTQVPSNVSFWGVDVKKEYAGTVFYDRYILGKWTLAELSLIHI